MSPESFDGKRSVQTDIWSVGVVLYQLLAGALPFPQEHPSERIFAILTKEFPPLPNDVPNSLQQIVAKSLAKQPENRYQTANEMREELNRALVGIEHPTLAKTEVLQIPVSNQTVTDVTNFEQLFNAQEPKKKTASNNPPPLSPEAQRFIGEFFQPQETKKETNQTQYQPPPVTENKVLPTEAQKFTGGEISLFKYGAALLAGIAGLLLVIIVGNIIWNAQNTSQSKNTSNSSAWMLMNIEVKTLGKTTLTMYADDQKKESVYGDPSPKTFHFTAQNSFKIEYNVYEVDKFQLKINGKIIKFSKTPPLGGYMSILEVTKDNLNHILQSGSNES
jgi:serine/threonine protein kinase